MTSIESAAALLGVLSHPARMHVVALLADHSPRTVGELRRLTGMESTALSHQLRILRTANLVTSEKQGRFRIYRLSDHHVAHIVRDAIAHVEEVG